MHDQIQQIRRPRTRPSKTNTPPLVALRLQFGTKENMNNKRALVSNQLKLIHSIAHIPIHNGSYGRSRSWDKDKVHPPHSQA